ncbi:hypothetical protein CNMCM5793_005952 [Aspergillus hiratsukae]|uniref:Uncharacterized protein n=1 Tax=Aspergillus hiratsukae TaxID=1194566 RepID=A0A8H6QI67_9EURO|nr:hypothetical protein CNMCM5793_005952 [Aspergillus hiratsukae]KAF7172667.1 hypothetical protein CNMCM6106_006834 [Aspergillus hiratsukae]
MIVAKVLLAALGLSAYAVAQDQDGQEQDVVLDAWPIDPNNVQAGGAVEIRWDAQGASDFQYTYYRG